MFCWGEQCARGFRLKDGTFVSDHGEDGAVFLDLHPLVTDLSMGLRALVFVKTNGNAFIIRAHQGQDGTRLRTKQKCVPWKEQFRAVSCSDDEVVLLSNKRQVISVDISKPHLTPRTYEALRGVSVSQVSCGSQHSVALTKDGQVFTWGVGSRGQLGLGQSRPGSSSPQPLKSVSGLPLVQVCAGGDSSFCLTVSGAVFGWGHNCCGQLGLGDTTDRETPTPLHHLNMKKTCLISCGDRHTAVLTKDGTVWTFGEGRHGQLGHNSFRDELRPRLVAELWGSKVTQVACGRCHTVVLTEAQRIYSFGSGAQGQLGRAPDTPAVPLPVQLPHELSDGPIRQIFSGGNCSFATCSSQDNTESQCEGAPSLDDLIDKWTSASQPWRQSKKEIFRMFSSASHLNRSFLKDRKHFETSSKQCGLDLLAAHSSFSKLLLKPQVLAEVKSVSIGLVKSLGKNPLGVEALRVYLLLTELLSVLLKNKQLPKHCTVLEEGLATALNRLPEDKLHILGQWWSSLPYSIRVRHVDVWKAAARYGPSLHSANSLLQVLQLLYKINRKTNGLQRLPDRAFTSPVLPEMVLEMLLYQKAPKQSLSEPPILYSFPFLMDLQTRNLALKMNAFYTMFANEMNLNWFQRCMEEGQEIDRVFMMRFKLDVRRECVLQDALSQLSTCASSNFKWPLAIHFNDNAAFDNVNQKDFFHLVFHEMVSEESGMFMFNDSGTLAWFPSKPSRPLQHYHVFGVLCGLAVFNLHLVFMPFPLALFKKLLGVRPSMDDLCQLSPCTGKSLRCLLEEYSDKEIQGLDMDFTTHWDGTEIYLDPDAPQRPLTGQNKVEFVEAFVEQVFSSLVQAQFEEFRRGFFEACDRHVVELFSPEELQKVMVGEDFNNWNHLKQSAVYEGLDENHPTVLMFWDVFEELTEEQRRALLWFVTGFERVPILTKKKLIMKIQGLTDHDRDMSEDQYYPKSHTCLNVLELPKYSTKDIMKSKLSEALAQISMKHQTLDTDSL